MWKRGRESEGERGGSKFILMVNDGPSGELFGLSGLWLWRLSSEKAQAILNSRMLPAHSTWSCALATPQAHPWSCLLCGEQERCGTMSGLSRGSATAETMSVCSYLKRTGGKATGQTVVLESRWSHVDGLLIPKDLWLSDHPSPSQPPTPSEKKKLASIEGEFQSRMHFLFFCGYKACVKV